jgi:hypothetical protein
MEHSEWFKKAMEHIEKTDPRELHKGIFGYYPEEYEEYINNKKYESEIQYFIDIMNTRSCSEIELYCDDSIKNPSKLFLSYVREHGKEGTDPSFWNGWGADYLDLPEYNFRYLWINGQGTVHYFQHIGVTS